MTTSDLQRRALLNALVAGGVTMLVGFLLVAAFGGGGPVPIASPSATSTPVVSCTPSWETVPSPDPEDGGSLLLGVSAIAADDAWAVGGTGDPVEPTRTLAIRWNGAEWDAVGTPNAGAVANRFDAVDALSPDAAWAVGRSSDGVGDAPLVAVWDGAAWGLQPLPGELGEGALTGVTALSTTDVWAAGYTGDPVAANERALLLHWDGTRWGRERIAPAIIGGGRSLLRSIAAVGPTDIWAVGYQRNRPALMHFDGTAWIRSNTDLEGRLDALGVVAPGDAWAVGTIVADLTGEEWAEYSQVREGSSLSSVSAVSAADVWAVGARSGKAEGEMKALVLRFNGGDWQPVAGESISGSETLTGVSALSDGTLLAVGYRDAGGRRSTLVLRGTTCIPAA
jgi:hypothetical protein